MTVGIELMKGSKSSLYCPDTLANGSFSLRLSAYLRGSALKLPLPQRTQKIRRDRRELLLQLKSLLSFFFSVQLVSLCVIKAALVASLPHG